VWQKVAWKKVKKKNAGKWSKFSRIFEKLQKFQFFFGYLSFKTNLAVMIPK